MGQHKINKTNNNGNIYPQEIRNFVTEKRRARKDGNKREHNK